MQDPNSNPESLVEWVRSEYLRKKGKNDRYSLRSFARDLELPVGRLSEILSSKRKITLNIAEKIAKGLLFSAEDRENFLSAVQRSRAKESEKLRFSFQVPVNPDKLTEIRTAVDSFNQRMKSIAGEADGTKLYSCDISLMPSNKSRHRPPR